MSCFEEIVASIQFLHKKIFFFNLFIVDYGEGNGTPLQYSCLENPLDGLERLPGSHLGGLQEPQGGEPGRGQTRSPTAALTPGQLSDFTFTFPSHALEKEMATHSSVLAWRIPGTGKPRGLPSMGSHRVGHK